MGSNDEELEDFLEHLTDVSSDEGMNEDNVITEVPKRSVISFESALDESSYNPADPIFLPKIVPTEVDRVIYEWKESSVTVGKNNAANVMRACPGPTGEARGKTKELECREFFYSSDVLEHILRWTNNKVDAFIENIPDLGEVRKKCSWIKPFAEEDLRAYFGFGYARGLLNLQNLDKEKLFQPEKGHPIFRSIMSYNRHTFISAMLTLDDPSTRSTRFDTDRFAAYCKVFIMINQNFAKFMCPDAYLAIDETLYPTRGKIALKTYNKDKPAKYGLNFRSLGSSTQSYIYWSLPYTGKPNTVTPAHITMVDELVLKIITDYEKYGHSLKGVNISMDRYYTSIPVAHQLLQKNITILGTMKANRKEIPPVMTETKGREINSWSSCKNNGLQMNSYVVKTKSSGLQNVLLLNTTNEAHYVTADEKMKPMAYKIYDYIKGGIDIPDQPMGAYTTKTKTRKWTRVANYYLLDTSRVNAQTVAVANGKKVESSFGFGWNLCLALVKLQIETRLQVGGLTTNLMKSIHEILGKQVWKPAATTQPNTVRRRCVCCAASLAKGSGHKERKKKLGKHVMSCVKCNLAVCPEHAVIFCKKCSE